MSVIAKLNYLRIAPRKARLVADLIRKKRVKAAQEILRFTAKRASGPILKLLKSAIANAKNNFQLPEENLYISRITVDEGPKLKRWRPRSRGMANPIQKKTSHILIILEEIVPSKAKIKKVKAEKIKEVSPEEIKEIKQEKTPEAVKSKLRPKFKIEMPKFEKGLRRIFRRKAF